MSEDETQPGMRIATVTITRTLTDANDIIHVEAVDGSGDGLVLVEALGLLRFAEDSVIRERMGEVPDE